MSDFWLNGACLADKDMGQASHRLVFYFHSFSLVLIQIKASQACNGALKSHLLRQTCTVRNKNLRNKIEISNLVSVLIG